MKIVSNSKLQLSDVEMSSWPYWSYGYYGTDGFDWRQYYTNKGLKDIPSYAEEAWPMLQDDMPDTYKRQETIDIDTLSVDEMVKLFIDSKASNKEIIRRMSELYHQVSKDITVLEGSQSCVDYVDKLDSISTQLKDIAQKDPQLYRYFLYGVFYEQINTMRHLFT